MPDKKYSSLKKDPIVKNIQSWKKEIETLSYEESIEILESILGNMQDDNISLDTIQDNYVKGNILLKHCQNLLETVEQEVKEISLEDLNFD